MSIFDDTGKRLAQLRTQNGDTELFMCDAAGKPRAGMGVIGDSASLVMGEQSSEAGIAGVVVASFTNGSKILISDKVGIPIWSAP